ncbi:MFS general substrate transporter [Meira miltonrushii]|uniref:MFS general substrate transporter n=1 Tax=Meira miltonrushii TaxID=1280837 RepID=A0A316VDH6_9BASI|nr:MFS general substrate transporter [Meira miltonrushii]PWN35374.1 MFS general substrate transporter [Meira miltonrushii]
MDAETIKDIEQVELELQPIPSRTETTTEDGLGIPTNTTRRRPSSHSRARANIPNLDNLKQQQQQQGGGLADEDVFVVEEEEDEDTERPEGSIKTRKASSIGNASRPRSNTNKSTETSGSGAGAGGSSSGGPYGVMPVLDTAPPTAAQSTEAFANVSTAEPSMPAFQARPPEIPNLTAEIIFILICSTGQLLFGFFQGGCAGLQLILIDRLGIPSSQAPWLQGSYLLANGLSVIVSGPLADLLRPKYLMCGAFAWQAMANLIGVFSLSNKYLFFVVRGMQGLAVGVLVSSSISILGRIYQPGLRKTRVFSIMAAMAPFGYYLGLLQGGAFSSIPKYIFATNTILAGICTGLGWYAIPNIQPALPGLSFSSFDFYGSSLAVAGCALLVAGLTQGPSANWTPYTIVIVMLGLVSMVGFFLVERKVRRPILPPALWKVPGFTALILAYFLGFGGFLAWQFYAIQFWLRIQHASPLKVALYQTPNAIFGVLATFIVSRIAHLVHGHWILVTSMIAFALGPVFFLPQTANTTYWALSMPGIALVTFGPDLSFAAASIFVTSSVAKHYQGSAGSLLVTVQNLSAAIMTSISDTIGEKVRQSAGEESLKVFHSIWWFDFAAAIVGALITLIFVRIPKTVEKEHEQ